MLNYTIVIPHKNSADLLQYCLDSIPDRDDVQVIVVDDNSDSDKVDYSHFPSWKGSNYVSILTKEGKGAGYCRNVALEKASGKWVLFLDADDYVKPCIGDIFDDNVNSDADIVFFRPTAVMLKDRQTPSKRADGYNKIIDDYKTNGDETALRTCFFIPTCKFVRRSLIEEHNIRFDEIRYSNDNYFAVSIGCAAKKIEVKDACYYVITESGNSLTSNFLQKPGELHSRAYAFLHASQVVARSPYRLNEGLLFYFATRLYHTDNKLYIQYIRFIHKECHYKKLDIYRRVFQNFNRKDRLKKYIKSILLELFGGS